MVEGPLAATSAYRVKVATSPESGSASQHLICIYIPDVYDKDAVTEVRITPLVLIEWAGTEATRQVMKVLLRNHGMNLSGVKSNMYTALGIDSKHPSGLQSTVVPCHEAFIFVVLTIISDMEDDGDTFG